MKNDARQTHAFTMVELMGVMAIIALFVAIAMPGLTSLFQSNKVGQARNIIKSYCALAKARAAQTQNYVGIRFEFDKDGWQIGTQYLVLIEHDPITDNYYAVPNTKPVALPKGVVVITGNAAYDTNLDDKPGWGNINGGMLDATTFSIVFAPNGQLAVKPVYVYPRQSKYGDFPVIVDKIFNHYGRVNLPKGNMASSLLYSDGSVIDPETGDVYPLVTWCYYGENSTTGFYIAEMDFLKNCNSENRYSQYVSTLAPFLINAYTGEVFERKDFEIQTKP